MAVRHSDCLEGGHKLSGTVLVNVPFAGRLRWVHQDTTDPHWMEWTRRRLALVLAIVAAPRTAYGRVDNSVEALDLSPGAAKPKEEGRFALYRADSARTITVEAIR